MRNSTARLGGKPTTNCAAWARCVASACHQECQGDANREIPYNYILEKGLKPADRGAGFLRILGVLPIESCCGCDTMFSMLNFAIEAFRFGGTH